MHYATDVRHNFKFHATAVVHEVDNHETSISDESANHATEVIQQFSHLLDSAVKAQETSMLAYPCHVGSYTRIQSFTKSKAVLVNQISYLGSAL